MEVTIAVRYATQFINSLTNRQPVALLATPWCGRRFWCAYLLTVMCVRVGTDSESTLRDAFVMFDEDKSGKLGEE